MVCTANDLQEWKDFPKGLKVLLLDGDINSASEIRAKLEAMDYNVSTFCDEKEALSAISSRPEDFHIAIVEVSTSRSLGGFKFLENAKDLPIIIEFLSKPLCEDKLRNIWQHVVHKAFNAGASVKSEPLKPIIESVVSMLDLEKDSRQNETIMSIDSEKVSGLTDNDPEKSPGSDKYPAPSTPLLKQGTRLLDDGDCQELINCSTEKESSEHDGEPKSVETTCGNLSAESTSLQRESEKTRVKEEEDFANRTKGESANAVSSHPQNIKIQSKTDGNRKSLKRVGALSNSCETKANRKKMKVDWTPELHKKFVKALEQLGIDQAIPSRILELMKVEGLTRHNVASHLQKYRMHNRHILPKEEGRKWLNQRDPMQRSYCLQRPIMTFPPYHSNHTLSPAPTYSMWGQPHCQMPGMQIWSPPGYPLWQPTESLHWKPFPGMHADAWGCPVLPPPPTPCFSHPQPQNMSALHNADALDYNFRMPQSSFEHYPADDIVDKVVKEALTNPWLPLPLGLNPPSTDSVVTELTMQGISSIPPSTKGSNPG
ncbi:hypothetical protein TanjilG_28068 [Lupinus angustifolius]|uniref:HTH myb-type domain-containing protein n=1 Tax=Lupinus angustifolius TaxID=3871 RepID=A0A4P1RGB3_LUPAN|nr:hypothetical protein TanjilG_28068 [Lupinus angustifolius]